MPGFFADRLAKSSKRRTDAPSPSLARIAWLLVTLFHEGVVEYAWCIDRFGISRREFQRDLHKLREIGKSAGFTISKTSGGRVFLQTGNRRIEQLRAKSGDVTATLARIAAALGGPVELEMRGAIGDIRGNLSGGFLHLREALPSDGSRVDGVFSFLKDAASSSARVEFSYKPAGKPRATRRVEPYLVTVRSGRSYLVAYDPARKDWRQFALDAIGGTLRRAGTFTSRPVPERFLDQRAVGWIRGRDLKDVTFQLSATVAPAVSSRQWQRAQKVRDLDDGGAEITLSFEDLAEAVRWALSFGAEAAIVAPPEAVNLARETIERVAALYGDTRTSLRRGTLTA
mgnify:CR=1 FL=1